MVLRRFLLVASSVLAVALVPGCYAESQKATDIFADGQMPKSLEQLANQFHEIMNVVGLTDRVERESTDKSLLPIAIIDCGMDLAHPDLVQKIAFDLEKGRLVGAGFDFMGNDRWASANLVNPTLYAIGADENADGKLTHVREEPLKYLAQLNQEFMTDLTTRIANDPVLSQSLFKNIGLQSMTLIGAINYTQDEFYRPETYQRSLKLGKLVNVDTRARMAKDPVYAKLINDYNSSKQLVEFLDNPWKLDPASGTPQAGYYSSTVNIMALGSVLHEDLFRAVVNQALNDFDKKSGFRAKIETYKRIATIEAGKFGSKMKGEELTELSKSLYLKLNGLRALDPMTTLAADLREALLSEEANKNKVAGVDFTLGPKDYNTELENNFGRFEEMVQYLDQSGSKSPSILKQVADLKSSMGPMRELFDWYRRERRLDSTLGASPKFGTPQASLYRRYLMRNSLPYFSRFSADAAHGTHTAGIVAAQDPSIRIVPVRVTTQSTSTSPSELDKQKKEFKANFTKWIQIPLVFRALGNEIKDIDDSDYSDLSESNRAKVASDLARAFDRQIESEFEYTPLEFQFLGEITSAIQFIGQRKIKIANISLGTSFSSVPTSLSELSQQDKINQLFDYLKYEYYKYEIGQAIRTYAPQTLFVVAAGNDGKWVDGVSRSALPMDISSPFLAAFEDSKKGLIAPNNNLSNILAVGSVDPQGELSSFTNILIGSKTPYVLAHGESILSPVKTTDLDSVTQLIKAKVPALLKSKIDADDLLTEFYKTKIPSTVKDEDRDSEVWSVKSTYEDSQKLLESLGAAVQLHMFLKYPNHRARMSGTSMATPAVTGIMGRLILAKAKRLGVSPQAIYDRPEFSPSALIEDMFKTSQPLGGSGGRGIAMSTLMGDLKSEPSQGAIDLEAALDQAVKNGASHHCLRAKSSQPDPYCN